MYEFMLYLFFIGTGPTAPGPEHCSIDFCKWLAHCTNNQDVVHCIMCWHDTCTICTPLRQMLLMPRSTPTRLATSRATSRWIKLQSTNLSSYPRNNSYQTNKVLGTLLCRPSCQRTRISRLLCVTLAIAI